MTCPDGIQQTVGSLLYEGLFRLDLQLEPQPWLCRSYSYDPATFTYTFTLRSGVTFSDGSALTAADVAATLQRARTSQRYGARLAQVAAVSAGDGVVYVRLSSANTGFPALLDIPIVKSGTETSLTPVGTGPYQVSSDEEGVCLTAHTGWWAGASPARGPHRPLLRPGPGNSAVSVLLSRYPADHGGPHRYGSHHSHRQHQLSGCRHHHFAVRGHQHPPREPFQDAAVRQALGLGINRPTLVSAVLSGHARAAQFPVSPVSALYPAELETLYAYDDFSAAMEAAGLTSGQTRTVTMLVNSENSFKVAAAESIAEALSDFDLQIQVQALPWEEYTAALAAGNFDLYYGEVKLTADWDLSALVGTGGSLNYGGWTLR